VDDWKNELEVYFKEQRTTIKELRMKEIGENKERY